MTNEVSSPTPGPWTYSKYHNESELGKIRALGLKPVLALTNDGQAFVMAGDGDDTKRVALVDCQVNFKRGKGHTTECAEREANARLIAAAPDLLALLIEARKWMDGDVMNDPWEKAFTERIDAAIAKATSP